MRRITLAALLALAFLVVGAPSCQPAEPAMTITAATNLTPICGSAGTITGVVDPPKATTSLILQRTSGGKWKDWQWLTGNEQPLHHAYHTVTTTPTVRGTYSLSYLVPYVNGGSYNLRVRSAGGGYTSPSFVVKPKDLGPTPDQCVSPI